MKNLIFINLALFLFASCNDQGTAGKRDAGQKQEVRSVREISAEIEKDPTNAELYYRRAGIYFTDQYTEMALADIEQALALVPDNPVYLFLKGRILYAMNRTIDAAGAYEKAIEVKPDYEEARMKLAELYFLVKEHKKANDHLNVLLAANKGNVEALFIKGMNYKDMGDTAAAVQAFQRVYEIDTRNYDAVMQLGILYAAANNKTALDYYIAASRLDPKNPEPPYNAGVYLQQRGELKKAVKMYEQALKADRNYYQAYFNAGVINVDVQQYRDALANFDAVVRINPGFADAYYMRGYCHEKLKQYEDARINYEYALESDPENTLAREGLKRIR